MASASDIYLPFLVVPYHLSPCRWNTLVSVLTQTIPAPPPGAGAEEGEAVSGVDGRAAERLGGTVEATGAGGGGGAVCAEDLAAAGAGPTFTMDEKP